MTRVGTAPNGIMANGIVLNKEACIRCGRCFRICPGRAVTLFDWPAVDGKRCTLCRRCVEICPTRALEVDGGDE